MRLQLEFLQKFLNNPNVEQYFLERNLKFANRDKVKSNFSTLPSYFANWLAGFIEAEGSFSNRTSGASSFSIAQNHDLYLIQAIRNFYGQNHLSISVKTGKVSDITLYEVSIANRDGVNRVISHCAPLLQGYKYNQLAEFVLYSKAFQDRVKEFYKF